MKAILLAAGKGTRLKPLTDRTPKVMIPVAGKPLLEWHVRQLAAAGIKDIFINLHHLPEKIRAYFRTGRTWGVRIRYSYEPEILGTAGAVKKLKEHLDSEPFLVVYGDNFIELDYAGLIAYARRKNGVGTVAVVKKADVQGSGIVKIGPGHRILRFAEKPRPEDVFSHWVNAGIFYFHPGVFEFIGSHHSDFSYDVLPSILQRRGRLFAYKLESDVWAIDSLKLLDRVRKEK
ncbi:MAG: nucleotidyltransferase family protein, partial [Candidatus Aminicenantes bacterium]|nr:nucleotidyltransferase family protein [Candidatus Aminicenantes bacterium]